MDREIKIKGAGLSGLAASILLANNGLQPIVYEKRAAVGSFFETDVHSFKNYGINYDILNYFKEKGIEIKNYFPVYSLNHVAPNGAIYKIFSKNKPIFYNVVRGTRIDSIDNRLYEIAKSKGSKFVFNSNSNSNDEFDVIATGSKKPEVIAYGKHYSNIGSKEIYIFQDNRYAPNGYIYLLPYLNNEATLVAVGFTLKFDIKQAFEDFIKNNYLAKKLLEGAREENEINGFGSFNLPSHAFINGKYFVGESAGLGDAARGFGMYYAITSGYLAAKAISENLDYDKLWKKEFGKELFERFARRQYMNRLTNDDHNRIIEETIKRYGSEIPIEIYQNRKKTSWYKKELLNLYARYKLTSWRKTHPLG